MPDSLSPDRLLDLQFLLIFLAVLVLLLGIVLVIRRVAGRGQALPEGSAGRSRQPRLGIVDVYELDRTRQLILLRRDNVEHLLLVGGANDLVVERNIVRAPARTPAEPPARAAEAIPAPVRGTAAGALADAVGAAARDRIPAPSAAADIRARAEGAAGTAGGPLPFEPKASPSDRNRAAPEAKGSPGGGAKPTSMVDRLMRRKAPAPAPVAEPATRVSLAKPPVAASAAEGGAGGEADATSEPVMADLAQQIEAVLHGQFAGGAQAGGPSVPIPATASAPAPKPPAPAPEAHGPDEAEGPVPGRSGRPPAESQPAPDPSLPAPGPGRDAGRASGDPAPAPAASEGKRPGVLGDGPFSLDDIETEFARLLGRPIDRKG